MRYIKPLNEKKPKGAPEFHHSDAPDAEGRFKDLGIKDLAAWLIKTRKKDVKKISGSLTQQIVFNRGDDPKYAEKMEKVRKEVYKQLGRQDLIDKMDESLQEPLYNSFFLLEFQKWVYKNRAKINRMSKDEKIKYLEDNYIKKYGKTHLGSEDLSGVGSDIYHSMVLDNIIKESIDMDDLDNAKEKLSNPHTILDITYDKTRRGDKFVRFDYENKYVPGKMLDSGPHFVNVRYDSNKDLKKISKELGMDLKESVLNEEDSYNDYPAAAGKNAQKAIDWKEKYGRDEVPAGTPVGWARAHQLAKGEKISADTVKRMSSFNRHRKNSSIAPEHKDEPWKDNGYVAWLIWGGDEGVDWAIEKSKEIDAMKESKQMKYIKPLHEAKRGAIHKAAKKGSYPVSIVVINSGMVVKQELVDTPAAVPAVFNELQKQYPNAVISVESNTGETLFSESVDEAKAYKLKASEFGADTHSAAYAVKGENGTWRVHSTYAIDQVSGENNPDERDVVFFEVFPYSNEIIIKIGGINNLKRTNGSTYGKNFGTTVEEWEKDPKGIAKEASDFLTDADHLKWINKKARSEGQKIKWALKDDYSSVIEDLVNKALGLSESVDEAKMPKKYVGNDDIVYLKTKEDSRGAHYNLYYKGHDIDVGGRRFGSEKELEDFASNYILSNQLYRKLRYEDSIPLPESVNESLGSYAYGQWVKENGKLKFPKWIKVKSKEIIDGGFMDKVYKGEHNYMSIWLGSFDNKTRSELYAYDDKGKKEFGEMGYKFIQRFWNDITGYTMFFWQGAVAALEVSKHIRDMEANGEAIEPAYYLMKEYFNNFGMETNRSRVFNSAVEKLEAWMKDNQIKTL